MAETEVLKVVAQFKGLWSWPLCHLYMLSCLVDNRLLYLGAFVLPWSCSQLNS